MILAAAVLIIAIHFQYHGNLIGVYGINRTVNWAWDLNNLLFSLITFLIYLIGYGIIAILKYHANRYLSWSHLILVSISVLFATIDFNVFIVAGLLSFIVFVMNMVRAVRNRKKTVV